MKIALVSWTKLKSNYTFAKNKVESGNYYVFNQQN